MATKAEMKDRREALLSAVRAVAEQYKRYLPLTLRQIYYQLVGAGIIENNENSYKNLSRLLSAARTEGSIPWEVMEDRTRYTHELQSDACADDFIEWQKKAFLTNYRRDLSQTQPKYLEVWIEKDALSGLFKRVCEAWHVRLVVCKGFMSTSFLHEYAERARAAWSRERDPVVIYFGDFDPSGMAMLESYADSLPEKHGVDYVIFYRAALNPEDVARYGLFHDPNALKVSDSRAAHFVERYGRYAVELDALPPDVLTQRIEESIAKYMDIERFGAEEATYHAELKRLSEMKEHVMKMFDLV